ncbi:hypothetical protein, partial [Intestinibacter sp.]|uniref:hypothetical protein n=1 Tax=Intestinibacter sp. TaxID=1965304 RepID=UPI002A7602F6
MLFYIKISYTGRHFFSSVHCIGSILIRPKKNDPYNQKETRQENQVSQQKFDANKENIDKSRESFIYNDNEKTPSQFGIDINKINTSFSGNNNISNYDNVPNTTNDYHNYNEG